MTDYRQQMHDLARALATKANKLMTLDPFRAVYLIHKPSEVDGTGSVDIIRDTIDVLPTGFELSMPERLSPARTLAQTAHSIYETMCILPILPLGSI